MTTPARVTLTLVKGRLEPAEYVYDERTTCVLGRSSDCSPRLPSDEHHRTVSRHHCLLDINPPDVRIRDFGSLNGTYVNGKMIGRRAEGLAPSEAAEDSYPEHDLVDGDEIRLGSTVFRVGITLGSTPGPVARHCAKCGRDLGKAADGRAGAVLCASCQAEPAAVLKLLLELAAGGRADLASISGYEVIRELGRGGMGAVYLARHEATGREVALKVMLPKVAASSTSRARFLREMALTRALRHPNVVPLLDTGFADGTFYLTTEYCTDGSLDRLLSRSAGGRLPADEALRITLQALDGLEHAHGQGVVHRDLSPSNILLHRTAGGAGAGAGNEVSTAKVADFGLAKAFDQAGLSGLTRTGAVAGKPTYSARQQVIDFRNASPGVDLWALAACLYQMLTGTVPRDFPREKDPWYVVLREAAVPIREREAGVPRALAAVIDEALDERPGRGFASAAELREALTQAGPTP
ncbi:protein kinase [Kitasatospora sp. NPDC093558]|uniref:protein kinase domain-containing protein n=1 Tax=Kitasatospora sp. NPDC093558 TaxID=3155201 RepID=UPI003418A134